MKNLKKIILVLVLTIMVGFIPNVYAKEIDSESLNELTEMINVDSKEIDLINNESEIRNKISETIKNMLKEKNIEYDENCLSISIVNYNVDEKGYYPIYVSYNKNSDTGVESYQRTLSANFNDSTTNASIRMEMNNKIPEKLYYLVPDKNAKITWDDLKNKIVNEVKALFNDNDIKVSLEGTAGSTGDQSQETVYLPINEWLDHIELVVYKDDVIKISKFPEVFVGVGLSTQDGKSILIQEVAENNNIYVEMKNVLSQKGYSNIIKAYELTLVEGTINGKLSVSIPVGAEHNEKEVIILHKKADGSYEEFTTTVKDGNASIEVTELSPFMIALKDSSGATKLSNNAQTSSMNIVLLSILSVLSLSGIIYLVIRNKKVA